MEKRFSQIVYLLFIACSSLAGMAKGDTALCEQAEEVMQKACAFYHEKIVA